MNALSRDRSSSNINLVPGPVALRNAHFSTQAQFFNYRNAGGSFNTHELRSLDRNNYGYNNSTNGEQQNPHFIQIKA